MSKVEQFIDAAMEYLGDKYSQSKRLVPGFSDCSSIIQKALTKLGWNTRPNVTVTTHRMGIEGDSRFRQIKLSEMQRGDLVWWHKYNNGKYEGHVGVFLGNNKVLEAIYKGVSVEPLNRLSWQRAYRIVALEQAPEPAQVKVEPYKAKGVIKTKSLNVRSANSTNSEILGGLKSGQEIDITGKAGSWFQIDFKGKKAFISDAYVDLINTKPIENIPVLVNGKEIKRGYIIDGITYITIGGKDKPVRQLFEAMGADVRWQDNKVQISL